MHHHNLNLLPSLTTTLGVCFFLPLAGLSLLLGTLQVVQYSPLANLGQAGMIRLLDILATFGGGHVWQGVLAIGLAISIVGGLFDTFSFYKTRQFQAYEIHAYQGRPFRS